MGSPLTKELSDQVNIPVRRVRERSIKRSDKVLSRAKEQLSDSWLCVGVASFSRTTVEFCFVLFRSVLRPLFARFDPTAKRLH